MNEELSDRVKALEERVHNIKDWKKLYEESEQERKELREQAAAGQKLKEALIQLLGLEGLTWINPLVESEVQIEKLRLQLGHKELIVDVSHGEKLINMTTATVKGKVLFCALTDLPKDGFEETDLAAALKEHGWNIGHSTLGPTLGSFVHDGYLILIGKKPAKYRLPEKVKLNVTPLEQN